MRLTITEADFLSDDNLTLNGPFLHITPRHSCGGHDLARYIQTFDVIS